MKKLWPFFILIAICLGFYWPTLIRHQIPSPLDVITGMYYPWMDQHFDLFPNGGHVKNPLPSDVVSLTLPLRHEAISQIKDRTLPLWNPRILSGTPLFANFQSAVLNPLNLIYFIPALSFISAWSVQIILQPILASIFFYLYISSYTKSPVSRIIGSILWGFNGFFSLWFQYNTVVYAALILPLALYFIDQYPQKMSGFYLALVLAFSSLAGNPPITLIVYGYIALYILYKNHNDRKKIILLFGYIFLSLLVASPQLVLGFQTIGQSIRDTDNIAQALGLKYLPIYKLITTVIPDYFGNPSTRNTWLNNSYYDNTTLYFGILPLILLILPLKKKGVQKKLATFCYFTALISLVLIVQNPLSSFLGNQKFFGLSSMVFTRFSLLLSLSVAIISTINLDRFITSNPKISWTKFIYIPITIFSILITSYFILNYLKTVPFIDFDIASGLKVGLRNSLLPLAISIVTTTILIIYQALTHKKIKIFILGLLIVTVIGDLYRFFSKYNSFSDASNFYPTSDLTDYLSTSTSRFIRESSAIIPSNMWLMYPNLKTPSGYDTSYSARYGQFISLINNQNFDSLPNRYLEIDRLDSPLIDLLSADKVVVSTSKKLSLPKYQLVKDYRYYLVYQNTTALPYVRSVSQVIFAPDTETLKNDLLTINHQNTAVTSDIQTENKYDLATISQLDLDTRHLKFTTSNTSPKPAYLTISTNYDTGWNLTIDGQKSAITPTNLAFIGFIVPPGTHQIYLSYYPKFLNVTIIISIASLILTPLWLIFKKHHD
ncbi:YfhO family protein [Candidatus Shapirobacteria bacterium]|nr:YfhO family protein [Candidatus Shapirobacteria bacterium]